MLKVLALLSVGLILLGMIGGYWTRRQRHKIMAAHDQVQARILREAIMRWQVARNDPSCPTVEQLLQERALDLGQPSRDSWNRPYRFLCTDSEVSVRSSGRDKQFDTPDDIVAPHPTH